MSQRTMSQYAFNSAIGTTPTSCANILDTQVTVSYTADNEKQVLINDMRWDNPDFITTGRSVFVDVLWPGVEQEPVWGNGFNSYRSIFTETGLERALPHNDWLKLWHDFGAVGMGLYALTMLLQIFFLTRIAAAQPGRTGCLLTARQPLLFLICSSCLRTMLFCMCSFSGTCILRSSAWFMAQS